MAAISNRMPPVAIVFDDTKGGRRIKQFADAYVAKRFFSQMNEAGRRPAVRPFDQEIETMSKTSTKSTSIKSTKSTKAAKAAVETTKAKPAVEKKEAVERDNMGCRVGSQAATINAQLSHKAKAPTDIAKGADLPLARVHSHLKFLVAKGAVVQTDAGYAMKK